MDHTATHTFIYAAMIFGGTVVLSVGGYMLYLLCKKEEK